MAYSPYAATVSTLSIDFTTLRAVRWVVDPLESGSIRLEMIVVAGPLATVVGGQMSAHELQDDHEPTLFLIPSYRYHPHCLPRSLLLTEGGGHLDGQQGRHYGIADTPSVRSKSASHFLFLFPDAWLDLQLSTRSHMSSKGLHDRPSVSVIAVLLGSEYAQWTLFLFR